MRKRCPIMVATVLGVAFGFITSVGAGQLLLDNASVPDGSGRKVSGPGVANGWTVFQPFDVPNLAGWHITSIGIDGWEVQDPMASDLQLMICADDGSGAAPDCSSLIATTVHGLGIDPFQSSWTDVPVDLLVSGGRRYWCVASAGSANYWSVLFHATSGLPSYSIQTSDGHRTEAGPTSLRIQGQIRSSAVPLLSDLGFVSLCVLLMIAGVAVIRRSR